VARPSRRTRRDSREWNARGAEMSRRSATTGGNSGIPVTRARLGLPLRVAGNDHAGVRVRVWSPETCEPSRPSAS